MKFFFNKNENGHEVAEEIVMVKETLDVRGRDTEQQEIALAIAMALQLYTDSIREDALQLSAQNLLKGQSAWNSKAHLLRQQPLYLPQLKKK